jgi:hypothetical protein
MRRLLSKKRARVRILIRGKAHRMRFSFVCENEREVSVKSFLRSVEFEIPSWAWNIFTVNGKNISAN